MGRRLDRSLSAFGVAGDDEAERTIHCCFRSVEVVDRTGTGPSRRRGSDDRNGPVRGDAGGHEPSTARAAVAQTDGGQHQCHDGCHDGLGAEEPLQRTSRAMFIATSAHDALTTWLSRWPLRIHIAAANAPTPSAASHGEPESAPAASAAPPATTEGPAAANQVTTPTETATSTASTTGEPVGDAPANAASTPDAEAMSATISSSFVGC